MSTKKGISHKDDATVVKALDKQVKSKNAKNRSALIAHYLRDGINGTVTEFKGPFKAAKKAAAKKVVKKAAKKAAPKKATKKAAKRVAVA